MLSNLVSLSFWLSYYVIQPGSRLVYALHYQTVNFLTTSEIDSQAETIMLAQLGDSIRLPAMNPGVYQVVITVVGVQIISGGTSSDDANLAWMIGEHAIGFHVTNSQQTLTHRFALRRPTDLHLTFTNFATIDQEAIPLALFIGQIYLYQQ
jgi:hypothetical protein